MQLKIKNYHNLNLKLIKLLRKMKRFLILIIFSIILLIFSYFLTNKLEIINKYTTVNNYENLNKKANFIVNNTYALVFFGRKAQMSILMRYLIKNLKTNGGVLDKIVFAVKTNKKEDLNYLDSIMNQNKTYFQRVTFQNTKRFREIYITLQDNDMVFKMDDDIVFIADHTFERMIEEYFTKNRLFLSANVVNHPLLSHVHARMGAISPYIEVENFTWIKSNRSDLDESECKFGGYNPFSICTVKKLYGFK